VAFEGFRAQSRQRPRRNRLMLALSIALHGGLLGAGVAYSFWHIDELTPPSVKVTFLSAAPPPPPPPPPAGGGGGAKKRVVVKPKIVPTKVPDVVQPRETPKEQPKETRVADNEPGGVKGGVKGGVIGGTIGGTVGGTIGGTIGGKPNGVAGGTIGGNGTAPVGRKFLPPNMGALQKQSGDEPAFPPSLRRAGALYVVSAKICVTRGGDVDSVSLLQRADPLLDDNVVRAVKGWRYRPLMADGIPVPFCYFGRFEFRGQ
jgi:periplasmic protein TonB